MPSQCASVYKLSTHVVVSPVSKTTAGVRLAVEPYQVLSNPVSPVELGLAIRRALAESREQIQHPTDWKALASPRLAAAGVKTEAAFQKKSQLVSAEFDGAVLTITPQRNGGAVGAEKGFHALVEHVARVSEASPEAIGNASLLAFEFCT
jgi:hypothetical protein